MVAGEPRSLTATKSMSAPAFLDGPEEVAADAAEAVDADSDRHGRPPVTRCTASGPVRRSAVAPVGPGRGPAVVGDWPSSGRVRRRVGRGTTSGSMPWATEGLDVGGHVVARGLRDLRPQVARRRPSGPGGRQRRRGWRARPTAASTLVNSDPGPRTIRSASAMAASAAGRRRRVGRHQADTPTMRPRVCTADLAVDRRAPSAARPSSTTGTVVAGQHRARRRRPGRPASSSAATKSPVALGQPGDEQVAEGVALELAAVEAVLERRAATASRVGQGGEARRRSPGAGMPSARAAGRWSRRRRPPTRRR